MSPWLKDGGGGGADSAVRVFSARSRPVLLNDVIRHQPFAQCSPNSAMAFHKAFRQQQWASHPHTSRRSTIASGAQTRTSRELWCTSLGRSTGARSSDAEPQGLRAVLDVARMLGKAATRAPTRTWFPDSQVQTIKRSEIW
eukprot:CAMPEP_0174305168 /NCGR_PEP_ID=MMETSP0809-20121228/61246_1 /TAXON_ID=73025 ORGANISM="Eutreptiella gymnastica-like, Strain CCMP1594" /NCGR_SAMPLE_ID=MMETSP0809 /ASSEMBLY_ACC=CAM_ASM_000658 /LENGTH=140 /DNA_ID=CAMNT_0015411585 /DNA_START=233 /DNA_END=653 /DNA_ORIENTATION=-